MCLKQENTSQIMQTQLNTKYGTLTVYLIIHASMSLQYKAHNPKFVIKFLAPTILLYLKIRRRGRHEAIYSSTPQQLPQNLTSNLVEKLFLKNGVN